LVWLVGPSTLSASSGPTHSVCVSSKKHSTRPLCLYRRLGKGDGRGRLGPQLHQVLLARGRPLIRRRGGMPTALAHFQPER
jgi:hypothetical protein